MNKPEEIVYLRRYRVISDDASTSSSPMVAVCFTVEEVAEEVAKALKEEPLRILRITGFDQLP